jgi:STAS domain
LAVPAPRTTVLAIGGSLAPADVEGLCARARGLLAGGEVAELVCDVGLLDRPDAVAVDALARLQLTARRHGARVLLRRASPALVALLAFVGLDAVLPLRVEA